MDAAVARLQGLIVRANSGGHLLAAHGSPFTGQGLGQLGAEFSPTNPVRDAGRVVAGISGWTWGDCCELQSLWVEPGLRGRGLATRLLAAAEAEAAARGCSQTVHFTYAFQARALYEQNGYELAGCVQDFPSGTDVLWYRKRLKVAQ